MQLSQFYCFDLTMDLAGQWLRWKISLTYHDECPDLAGSLQPRLMIPMTTSPATLTSQNASKPMIMTISGIG